MPALLEKWVPAFIRNAGVREWQFTLRTFAASMLALYIALSMGLDQPMWSMMTVYIVAQPLGGMALAKGSYRLLGTLVGATMALTLVNLFAQQHLVFFVAIACWLGVCTCCASLLRNFRSYAFVLAGYTALIIGLPGVLQPDHAFTEAVARVTEIGLGIFCGTLASMLIWPVSAGDTYLLRAQEQLEGLVRLVADSAAGHLDAIQLQERRRALLTTGIVLENLREHALFDSARLRRRAGLCRRLGHEMLAMVSSVGALNAYVTRYASQHRLNELQGLLEGIGSLDPKEDFETLRQRLSDLHARARRLAHELRTHQVDDNEYGFYALQLALEHAGELCDRLRSSVVLLAMLSDRAPMTPWRSGNSRLHLDYQSAWRNGVRAALALAVGSLIWFWSESSEGPEIVIMAGMICALFSTRADPLASAGGFIKGAFIAAGGAMVYRLLLLPGAEGFAALVWWLAPIYLLAGLAMRSLPVAAMGTAVAIFFPLMLDLGPSQDFTAVPLFNNILGLAVGMTLPVLAFLLLWPGDDAATARSRLCRDLCHTLGRWPIRRRRPRHEMETALYDRIARTLPLLTPDQEQDGELLRGAMTAVVLGLGLLYLDALCRRGVPQPIRLAITRLIRNTQRTLREGDEARWRVLVAQADDVLHQCQRAYNAAQSDGERRRLVRAVVRLRMQMNIIQNYTGFFVAGSGAGPWGGLAVRQEEGQGVA